MKALISGQAALVVLFDGNGVWSFTLDEPDLLVPRRSSDLRMLFGTANDLVELPEATHATAVAALRKAWARDRVIHMALILLEEVAKADTRLSAAECLDEFLGDPSLAEYATNLLTSSPLPKGGDLPGAIALAESKGLVQAIGWLRTLESLQPSISSVRSSWDALPTDLFAKEAGGLDPESARLGQASMAAHAGVFRILAEAGGDLARVKRAQARCRIIVRTLPISSETFERWMKCHVAAIKLANPAASAPERTPRWFRPGVASVDPILNPVRAWSGSMSIYGLSDRILEVLSGLISRAERIKKVALATLSERSGLVYSITMVLVVGCVAEARSSNISRLKEWARQSDGELQDYEGGNFSVKFSHLRGNSARLSRILGDLPPRCIYLIKSLDLRDQALVEIPESIGDLTALNKLELGCNGLRRLPASIGKLTALRDLDLNQNDLEALPDSIGNLTALNRLDLNFNGLQELPESIGNLSALRLLKLNRNDLKFVPKSIGRLTSLTSLDLGVNGLEELPESIGNLTSLTLLKLNKNDLHSLPDSIGRLTALTIFEVDYNGLNELPKSIGRLTSLNILFLNNNQFKEIPEIEIAMLPNLTTLVVDNNPYWNHLPSSVVKKGSEGLLRYLTKKSRDDRQSKLIN